ncbi:tRNA uridine-5-carboxymethylaminomethyl(34) synthesis GTPase MnmE [Algicella marina]|uniref:tRNA modification GTPase MnmE n=1 Tax=Algicella marina TaxID=2683284 RepID=A0A6P1T4H0_9RHOB|nr:tRNA uridine-5-carboxymethylaminomethyl(34) synthesis GTPase MnmE [Algicella marina]QHQ36600.1 tRNA uridine-5-carboxymethylaminomethyl(34) synthesis GTPase MnmE [Algicella marina]
MRRDTIFAEATVPGRGGVSVIRVSGPDAWTAAERMAGALPAPRMAGLRQICDPADGRVLDEGLVLAFEAGASFTGEPVVEFQLHGSRAVVRAILGALGGFEELRLAEAGEFTRRAMENGRLDLGQVEALGDLIDAETEAQRLQALRGMDGILGRKTAEWRADLVRASGLLTACLDFSEEELPDDLSDEILTLIERTAASVQEEVQSASAGERVRNGFEVAIVGRPNAGKSTLLNALARRDVALTSDIAGTTRDIVEARLDLKGHLVTLLDTAGLRATDDVVEGLGISRARQRAEEADLRVFLLMRGESPDDLGLTVRQGDLVVDAKGDQLTGGVFPVSGLSGLGLDRLLSEISDEIVGRASFVASASNLRQKAALEDAATALVAADQIMRADSGALDLVSENLRISLFSLDRLIGRVDVEDMLDVVFSSFCVGK